MPVLPICDATGHPIKDGVVHTFAAMFYPDDAQRRRSFVAMVLAEVAGKRAKPDEIVTLSPSVLLDALKADKHPMSPEGDGGRWYDGTVAGAQVELNRVQFETRRFQFRSSPPWATLEGWYYGFQTGRGLDDRQGLIAG